MTRARLSSLAAGAMAGLVAALGMTLAMGLLRWGPGIPSTAELIAGRLIPRLTIDQFIQLLIRFGGPNDAKQFSALATLGGQLIVGVLIGASYAAVVFDHARRRGAWFVRTTIAASWLASLILLWPVLDANYRGLPASAATAATAAGLLMSYAIYGVLLTWVHGLLTPAPDVRAPVHPVSITRRAFLAGGLGVGLAVASGGVLSQLRRLAVLSYDGLEYRGPNLQPVVPNSQFYIVTKNVADPEILRSRWRLDVTGAFDRPRAYRYEELIALPAVTQETTLECISNGIGGGLMSNAIWHGVPLRDLLAAVGMKPSISRVVLHAVDGDVDTIPLEKALEATTIIAYAMNAEPLPHRHGYPARLVVPGRYGEKSVKWLTRIEPVTHLVRGYYEQQGWGPTWEIQTISRFDTPTDGAVVGRSASPDGSVRLAGTAFAGDRGIWKG